MKNEKSNFGFFLMKIMVNFEAFDWNFSLSTNPEIEGRVTILLFINREHLLYHYASKLFSTA